MSKRTEWSFFKGKKSKWLKTLEEMLSICGYKGNANQDHVMTLPHTCQNG
jgi:hypothetical protein